MPGFNYLSRILIDLSYAKRGRRRFPEYDNVTDVRDVAWNPKGSRLDTPNFRESSNFNQAVAETSPK